jgi:hypothetical protein
MYNMSVTILPHYESHKADSSNGLRQTQSKVQPNVVIAASKFCVFASLSFCETGNLKYDGEDQPFATSGQETSAVR